jgi:hypothetical protein
MLATLAQHRASDQWTRGVRPNLITWLKRGDWRGTRKLAAVPAKAAPTVEEQERARNKARYADLNGTPLTPDERRKLTEQLQQAREAQAR